MAYYHKADVELREACRKEIQEQVDRFLAQGRAIEKVTVQNKLSDTTSVDWATPSVASSELKRQR